MRNHAMKRAIKWALILLGSVVALFVIARILMPSAGNFFLLQADSIQRAGTWEDDPKNWYRAFNEEQPSDLKIVHSKYWRSNHFTYEFVYYFEVEATPAWRDAFLKKRNAARVSDVESIYRAFALAELPRDGIPRQDVLGDQPWGMREFAIVDPDGNLIRIGQALG